MKVKVQIIPTTLSLSKAHSNTRTSNTNKAFVFSESAISEAVEMTRDFLFYVCELDKCPVLLSIQIVRVLLGVRENVRSRKYIIIFMNVLK